MKELDMIKNIKHQADEKFKEYANGMLKDVATSKAANLLNAEWRKINNDIDLAAFQKAMDLFTIDRHGQDLHDYFAQACRIECRKIKALFDAAYNKRQSPEHKMKAHP